jgi:hypothetical protein
MFRRNNKTRKYQAPIALVTHMVLESNFCQTLRLNAQVDELHNMNLEVEASKRDTPDDPFYFEF